MSYEFIKLSEVEKIDTPHNASLLIEENGEIKRLPTENVNFGGSMQQVQADWKETDDTSPAYIMNKPERSDEIIYIYPEMAYGSGIYAFVKPNGEYFTVNELKEYWKNGSKIRFDFEPGTNGEFGSAEVIAADLRDYTS